jgi:hypothetical protein
VQRKTVQEFAEGSEKRAENRLEVEYAGRLTGCFGESFELWNTVQAFAGNPPHSTVTAQTLNRLGLFGPIRQEFPKAYFLLTDGN